MNPLAAIIAILAFYSAYSHTRDKHEENSKNLREVKFFDSASIENTRPLTSEYSLEEAEMPTKGGKGGKGKGKEYEDNDNDIDYGTNDD